MEEKHLLPLLVRLAGEINFAQKRKKSPCLHTEMKKQKVKKIPFGILSYFKIMHEKKTIGSSNVEEHIFLFCKIWEMGVVRQCESDIKLGLLTAWIP